MRLILVILVVCSAVQLSLAEARVSCGQSERFGSRLILVGDSDRRVFEAKPDRTVLLETAKGGAAGYRFDFYRQGQTIQVYVRAGVVIRICRIRS